MDSAYFSRAFKGSAPGESTKTNGTDGPESLKTTAKSKIGGTVKYGPILSTTKFEKAGTNMSGLIAL